MRRFDLTGRTLAGLLALGLILGGAPRAQAAEADTQGTALTGPAEENSIPPLLPLEPSTPERPAPASAEQYLAALDRLLNMGLSQEEARQSVAPPGRIGDRRLPPGRGGGGTALPAPAEFCPSGAAGPLSGGAGPVAGDLP